MEWKIGEIFEYNDEWYQCVKGNTCNDCAFYRSSCGSLNDKGGCRYNFREDATNVIFKKLEKVGEPVTVKGRTFQKLTSDNNSCKECVFNVPNKACCKNSYIEGICDDNGFWIEIKQNKEDMEGKTNLYEKQTPLQKLMEIYCDGRMDYNEFEKKVKELYSDKGDDSGPTLKEFDIEAAKSGKPVCTRDGRKARIICFDTKGDPCPIIALVEENGIEAAYHYDKNGQNAYNKSKLDLMMLPEKKEGWVNIDKGGSGKIAVSSPYSTKEEAIHNDNETTIDTIKISWEE